MNAVRFTGRLKDLIDHAISGKPEDIDHLMKELNPEVTFANTRFIDYALSHVNKEEGIKRISYYLFQGTPIQRNYASLYFNRKGDWKLVKEAFALGLIDDIQAFAR